MIRENQQLLNRINVVSDGAVIFLMMPAAYAIRFYVLPDGIESIGLSSYLWVAFVLTLIELFTFASLGLYQSFRKVPLRRELGLLLRGSLIALVLLLGWLFLGHEEHYSRWTFAIFFGLSFFLLSGKRVLLRTVLRRYRKKGYNQKRVLIVGNGPLALKYQEELRKNPELGYETVGYIGEKRSASFKKADLKEERLLSEKISQEVSDNSPDASLPKADTVPYLGAIQDLDRALKRYNPDEVILAIDMEDYPHIRRVIDDCERNGCKLLIIPFYAEYMQANPYFDELGGIPLLNIRHIPLDNWMNAFIKRAGDIIGSLLLLILTSPVMLVCAILVSLSSPGPVIFRQKRVGRNKKPFFMYKFRSMVMNDSQDTGWSSARDDRRTRVGAFMRKYSLDEFPQFLNVLKGDMSLVGPRPEVPHFVEQFREEIPLYMVRHQVRPGITGWAQICGLRGDTSIKERIEHDLYYIENWSVQFDIRILLTTVFKGKFINDEKR